MSCRTLEYLISIALFVVVTKSSSADESVARRRDWNPFKIQDLSVDGEVVLDDVTLFPTGEGIPVSEVRDGREGWTVQPTLPNPARFLYMDVHQNLSTHVKVSLDIHDGGYRGLLPISYDSTDETVLIEARFPGAWKTEDVELNGSNTWTTVELEWIDARFENRQNGHDIRIILPESHTVLISNIQIEYLPPVIDWMKPVKVLLRPIQNESIVISQTEVSIAQPNAGQEVVCETYIFQPINVHQWLSLECTINRNGGNVTIEISTDSGNSWISLGENLNLTTVPVRRDGTDRITVRVTLIPSPSGTSPTISNLTVNYQSNGNDVSTLTSEQFEIVFGPTGVRALNSKQPDVSFLHTNGEAPLFRIAVKPIGRSEPQWIHVNDTFPLQKVVQDNSISQTFLYPDSITITCGTHLAGDSTTWSIEIDNQSNLEIAGLQYPLFQGIAVGSSESDDVLILPTFWQQIINNPIQTDLQPIRNLAMRWFYLYDSEAGIYFGDHNWPVHDLTFLLSKNDVRTINSGFKHDVRISPGESFTHSDYVISVQKGDDWHLAADIYRNWGSQYIQSPSSPAWTQIADGWAEAPSDQFPGIGYSGIASSHDEDNQRGFGLFMGGNRAQIDGPIEHVGLWPTYCPAYGSLKELHDVLSEVRLNGGHTNWYFNWQLLSPARVIDRTRIASIIPKAWVEHDVSWPTLNWYERTALRGYSWSGTEIGTDFDEISQCVGSTLWQQHLYDRTKDWVTLYGADGMYYDQLSAVNNFCGNLEHGHEDYGIWTTSSAEQIHRIARDMRQINPHFVSSGEGCNDVIGQFVDFQLTSGVWNHIELYQYCFPNQIILDGWSNGGTNEALGGDNRWRYIWMCGARFEGLPNGSYFNDLLSLRKKIKTLLYPSRFMDTVGLVLRQNGSILENPPRSGQNGVEIAPVHGPQAKWFLLSPPHHGAIVNVIQEPENTSDLQISIPTIDIGPVETALVFHLDGTVEQITGSNSDGRFHFTLSHHEIASSILLVNEVYPQILDVDLPFAASPGSIVSGTALVANYGRAPARVNVRWDAPDGWNGLQQDVALDSGKTQLVPISLTLPADADVRLHDVTLVAETNTVTHRFPHWITVGYPLGLRLINRDDDTIAVTVVNRSSVPQAGEINLFRPDGVTLETTSFTFTVDTFSQFKKYVKVSGLDRLPVPPRIIAQTSDPTLAESRELTLFLPIPNGDFENDTAGDGNADYWLVRGGYPLDRPAPIDLTQAYTGNSSIRIDPHPLPGQARFLDPICSALDVGKRYRLRVAIKKSESNDDAYVQVYPRPHAYNLTTDIAREWVLFDEPFRPATPLWSTIIFNRSRNPLWVDALSLKAIEPRLLYGPWFQMDIGLPKLEGDATYDEDTSTFSVFGTGAYAFNLDNFDDNFHFVYQPLRGDGSITAMVKSFDGPSGLMIRESLSEVSNFAMCSFDVFPPDYFYYFHGREGEKFYNIYTGVGIGANQGWLRITRQGKDFEAFFSKDGTSWKSYAKVQIDMASQIFVGIAVNEGTNSRLAAATFENVTVDFDVLPTPTPKPPPVSIKNWKLYE